MLATFPLSRLSPMAVSTPVNTSPMATLKHNDFSRDIFASILAAFALRRSAQGCRYLFQPDEIQTCLAAQTLQLLRRGAADEAILAAQIVIGELAAGRACAEQFSEPAEDGGIDPIIINLRIPAHLPAIDAK